VAIKDREAKRGGVRNREKKRQRSEEELKK